MKQHIQTVTALIVIVGMATIGSKALNVSHALNSTNVTTPTIPITQGAISLPSVASTSVDSFIDSEGVNIHSSYLSSPYGSGSNIATALTTLGIHNVRDNPSTSAGATELGNLGTIASRVINKSNVKFNFVINSNATASAIAGDSTPIASLVQEIDNNSTLAANTIGFEGANELDGKFGNPNYSTSWASNDFNIEQTLNNDAKSGHFTVVAPSMSGIDDTADAPSLAATGIGSQFSIGNIHSYPHVGSGATPESTIQSHVTAEKNVSGSNPIWATESGYNDCSSPCGSSPPTPVSASDQAVLDPRIFLADYQANVSKTFMYELFDEANESDANSTFQDDWGLFNNNLTAKPSAQAIANMNAILAQNDGGAATIPSLSYQITGGNSNLEQMLLSKHTSSGDHYDLVVWQNSLPGTASGPITISFASSMNVAMYTPSSSGSPIASYNSVTNFPGATSGPAIAIYDITDAPVQPPPTCTSNCGGGGSSGSGSSGSSSGSTTTNGSGQSTSSKTTTLTSLGSAKSPIETSSVTLAPDTSVPTKDITKVSYYIDGKLTATETKSPFTYNLTAATLKNGCHTIKTVVYTTAGGANTTNRQLCVAFAKNTVREREWGVGVACLIIILLVLAEFAPFYPKNYHLVSRTALKLWNKIHHKNIPPSQDNTSGHPQNQTPNNTADSSSYTPGHIFQPFDKR